MIHYGIRLKGKNVNLLGLLQNIRGEYHLYQQPSDTFYPWAVSSKVEAIAALNKTNIELYGTEVAPMHSFNPKDYEIMRITIDDSTGSAKIEECGTEPTIKYGILKKGDRVPVSWYKDANDVTHINNYSSGVFVSWLTDTAERAHSVLNRSAPMGVVHNLNAADYDVVRVEIEISGQYAITAKSEIKNGQPQDVPL